MSELSNGNKRKYKLLGESYGAAIQKLRKSLLFDFASRLGLLNCYRCGDRIENISDFSIDHIEPWESASNPIDKFFDIGNIAFSHLGCNISAGERPSKKLAPSGMAWCYIHKKFLPVDRFYKHSGRWNGLQKSCKEHRKKIIRSRGGVAYRATLET